MTPFNVPNGDLVPGIKPTREYLNFFKLLLNGVLKPSLPTTTTAGRPTKELSLHMMYFDIDLGKPIWLKSFDPIIWVDASGAVV